jgi:hypothetical protein
MRDGEGPLLIFLGLLWGFAATSIAMSLGVFPSVQHQQFNKDCIQMVHGKTDGNICERDGKILFHKK